VSAHLYACAAAYIPVAFVDQWLSDLVYISVALVWLIPDRGIERTLERS
jgi:hypothetical protein